MLRIIIFIGISYLPISTWAQTTNQILFNDQSSIEKISKGGGGYRATSTVNNESEGSPLLFDWATAQIVMKGKGSVQYEVTYDAARDIFLMRYKGLIWEIEALKIDTIRADDRKFITIGGGYYQTLNNGTISLLKKYKASLLKPNYIPALNTGSKQSRWQISDTYFLQVKDELTEISLSKKAFQKSLSLSPDDLKKIEAKGLKFNKEADVIAILLLLQQGT